MSITINNPDNRPLVTGETAANVGVSIGIDYTEYYSRIATAMETIATNSTAIKNSIAAIETQQTTLVTQQTTIANKITALEARAAGAGIHTVSPWEWIGISSMVRVLQQTNVDLVELKNYVENNVPRTF